MKWLWYVIILIVIVFTIYIYVTFNGTPWGKADFRKQAAQYLEQKYDVEFQLKLINYDFKDGDYFAVYYVDDEKSAVFSVYPTNKGLRDDYFISKWEAAARSIIKSTVEQNLKSDTEFFIKIDPNHIKDAEKTLSTMASNETMNEEVHPFTSLSIRIERQFELEEDIVELRQFFTEMNAVKVNVHKLRITYWDEKYDLDLSTSFEIDRDYGEPYPIDDIMEYRTQ